MFYASLHWNSFENDFSFRPRTQSPTHTHTDAHRSEVNLLDVLYALNGRRTSSSSNRNRNGSGNGNGSLLNSCSALLSGSSACSSAAPGVVVCLSPGDSDFESRSAAGSGKPQDRALQKNWSEETWRYLFYCSSLPRSLRLFYTIHSLRSQILCTTKYFKSAAYVCIFILVSL